MPTRCTRTESQGRQKRARGHPEPLGEHGEGDFQRASVRWASLKPPRRPPAEHLPHQNSEIERAGVDQESFENVPMPAQVSTTKPAGVVHVGEGTFNVLPAPTSAPCKVTATIAPLSRSMACSALCARCVRPSFIFVILASGSKGFFQSLFDVPFFRRRSSRASASIGGGRSGRRTR